METTNERIEKYFRKCNSYLPIGIIDGDYFIIHSRGICGEIKKEKAFPDIGEKEVQEIATSLQESCSEEDGEPIEMEYQGLFIEAICHYRSHMERGGDSYCGVWEMVEEVDEHRVEVLRVIDADANNYPGLVYKINEYVKTHF